MSDLSDKAFPKAARFSPGEPKETTEKTRPVEPHRQYRQFTPFGETVYQSPPESREAIGRNIALADEDRAARESAKLVQPKKDFNQAAHEHYTVPSKKNKSDDFGL